MSKSTVAKSLTLATLASVCTAWMQIPLVVINMSPYEAKVDFRAPVKCMQEGENNFDTDYLNHYYDSWESGDLGKDFGDQFKP